MRYSQVCSHAVEVPNADGIINGRWNNLFFIWAPSNFLNWAWVAETLSEESKLQSVHWVDEHFVGLSSISEISSAWANLDRANLVWIRNVSNRVFHITIPEENRRTLTGRDQLKFVISALGHSAVGTISDMAPVYTFFCLQVICANRFVSRARVN